MPIDENLTEIINVISDGAAAIQKNFADGFQISDLFALVPIFAEIPAAIQDADHALNYLKDMTPEKEDDIVAAVLAKIQDASQKTKDLVTFILRTLANAYMIYVTLKSTQDSVGGTGN